MYNVEPTGRHNWIFVEIWLHGTAEQSEWFSRNLPRMSEMMGAKILEEGSAVLRSSIWEGVAHDWLGVNKRAKFRGRRKLIRSAYKVQDMHMK
jgi:hypothetical protein